MITRERLEHYKKQAISSVAARAEDRNQPGVTCVVVTPHDLLDLVLCYEEQEGRENEPS